MQKSASQYIQGELRYAYQLKYTMYTYSSTINCSYIVSITYVQSLKQRGRRGSELLSPLWRTMLKQVIGAGAPTAVGGQ